MRRKLQLTVVLFAWLLATGSHWDLVQTFGWGRMIASYSKTMPLGQAIRLTFTPDNMCGVCEAVSEAKQHDDRALPSNGKTFGKIVMVFQPVTSPVIVFTSTNEWLSADRKSSGRERARPPVRPPLESV